MANVEIPFSGVQPKKEREALTGLDRDGYSWHFVVNLFLWFLWTNFTPTPLCKDQENAFQGYSLDQRYFRNVVTHSHGPIFFLVVGLPCKTIYQKPF